MLRELESGYLLRQSVPDTGSSKLETVKARSATNDRWSGAPADDWCQHSF